MFPSGDYIDVRFEGGGERNGQVMAMRSGLRWVWFREFDAAYRFHEDVRSADGRVIGRRFRYVGLGPA